MRVINFFIQVCIAFCFSCIEPYDIELVNSKANLVVDGMITDAPGPYTIKIYRTKPLNAQLDKVDWVQYAKVWILDDSGVEEELTEVTPGNYVTSATGIQGVVGRTYTLRIQIGESSFESSPQIMTPVGEINKLYHTYKQDNDPATQDGIEVFIDAKILPGQSDLIRWRTEGTFEILTFPEKRTKKIGAKGGGRIEIPDPPKCSGWIYLAGPPSRFYRVGPCTCCSCWITKFNETPVLSDPIFTQNGELNKVKVAFVPNTKNTFYKKYFLQVEQLSISEPVYRFWETVRDLRETGSDLFQTPAGKTIGNISSVNTNEIVIGVFGVSAVKQTEIVFYPDDVPFMGYIDEVPKSCLHIYNGTTSYKSSNKKPFFW